MKSTQRYALSFTSGSLFYREAVRVASVYLHERDWGKTRARVEGDNLLQARTLTSSTRRAREVTQRLATLSEDELELLVDATPTERGHLLWAAVCRRYDLVGEFAEEVLRERFLLLAKSISHDDFDRFLSEKALWHEEITNLQDSTRRKMRANLFRMMVEAGLLSGDWEIIPTTMSARVLDLLDVQRPSDIRFFPIARND